MSTRVIDNIIAYVTDDDTADCMSVKWSVGILADRSGSMSGSPWGGFVHQSRALIDDKDLDIIVQTFGWNPRRDSRSTRDICTRFHHHLMYFQPGCTTYTDSFRDFPADQQIMVIISDGHFSDGDSYRSHLNYLLREGKLSKLTYVFVFFVGIPANSRIVTEMTQVWMEFWEAPNGIAMAPPVIRVFSNPSALSPRGDQPDLFLNIIKDNVHQGPTLEIPPGPNWMPVSGFMAFDRTKPAAAVAEAIDEVPGLSEKLVDDFLKIVKTRPQVLKAEGTEWGLVYKIIMLTASKDSLVSKLFAYRDNPSTPAETKAIINEVKAASFVSDTGAVSAVLEKLSKLFVDLVLASTGPVDVTKITDAVSSKSQKFLIDGIFGNLSLVHHVPGEEFPGMPIVKTDDPVMARLALSLLCLQWCPGVKIPKDMMGPMIFELYTRIVTASAEVKSELAPLLELVVTAIKDEDFMLEVLGYDNDKEVFDPEKNTLLYSYNNCRCVAKVLEDLRKSIFSLMYASRADRDFVRKLEKHYRAFAKITNWQTLLTAIKRIMDNKPSITREVKYLKEGSAASFDDPLSTCPAPFTIVRMNSLPAKVEAVYTNIPIFALVTKAVSTFSNKKDDYYDTLELMQLDEESFVDWLADEDIAPDSISSSGSICDSRAPDSVTFKRSSVLPLRLHAAFEPPSNGTITPEYIAVIDRVNRFFCSLKGLIPATPDLERFKKSKTFRKYFADGSDAWSRDARPVRGLADEVANWVNDNICLSAEAEYDYVHETIPLTADNLCATISVPESLKPFLHSGTNPNMKQALAFLDSAIVPPAQENSVAWRDRTKVVHEFPLTPDEQTNFRRLIEETHANVASYNDPDVKNIPCVFCWDNCDPNVRSSDYKCPCGARICRSCQLGGGAKYLRPSLAPGQVLEMPCLQCPSANCFRPIPTLPVPVREYLETDMYDKLTIQVSRLCISCGTPFAQERPAGQCAASHGIETVTSSKCIPCVTKELEEPDIDAEWHCPHPGCGFSGTRDYGCDYINCPACDRASCYKCQIAFTEEEADDMGGGPGRDGDWTCLGQCTHAGIESALAARSDEYDDYWTY